MCEVRFLTPDDWQAWRDVRLRSLADSPEAFGSTHERELAFSEDVWRERCKRPAVLAFDDGRPVAIGSGFEIRPGVLLVVAMWVEPAYRGRGLSREILDAVVGWGREQGLVIELEVVRDNGAARTAYENYGFVPTGHSEPVREGSDLIADFMRLPDISPS